MHKVLINQLKPGMVLGKNIYSNDGKILLANGVVLKSSYINKLIMLNIPAVYITDPNMSHIEVPELIQEETRVKTIANTKAVFEQIASNNKVNLRQLCSSVGDIIDELLGNSKVLYNLNDIRSHDNYTFAHCVNVAVLSILTGISLKFNQLQLRDLGVGAIMHDIGKMAIDIDILNKPGQLNVSEFETIKEHSNAGFNLLRQSKELSTLAAHVAFQHHEKVDGTGYPRGLMGNEIHIYAKITAVADVYDALVADRVYRSAYTSHEAAEIVDCGCNIHFDPEVTRAFLSNIAIFPLGCLVKLNTSDIAVVVDNNRDLQTRPVIRLLDNSPQLGFRQGQELDLCKHASIYIEKIIKPSDPEYLVLIKNSGQNS